MDIERSNFSKLFIETLYKGNSWILFCIKTPHTSYFVSEFRNYNLYSFSYYEVFKKQNLLFTTTQDEE